MGGFSKLVYSTRRDMFVAFLLSFFSQKGANVSESWSKSQEDAIEIGINERRGRRTADLEPRWNGRQTSISCWCPLGLHLWRNLTLLEINKSMAFSISTILTVPLLQLALLSRGESEWSDPKSPNRSRNAIESGAKGKNKWINSEKRHFQMLPWLICSKKRRCLHTAWRTRGIHPWDWQLRSFASF